MIDPILPPVITIDGPTSSGKGTIGKLLAEKLGWNFLDSGALYRVVALIALERNTQANEHAKIINLTHDIDVEFVQQPGKPVIIYGAGRDITLAIRQEGCGVFASQIAVIPGVRAALFEVFLRFRKFPGLVADGRDMGTVVFPDAILKIFLTASQQVRAQRRRQQLQERGISVSLREVELDLSERDMRDSKRIIAPLKPAPDACVVDSTNLSINEVLEVIVKHLPRIYV